MPEWFVILAKVLSMLSYLIPQVEKTFNPDINTGAEKKQAVLARVATWLDSPQAAAADPYLDANRKQTILTFADTAVDHIVKAANAADAMPRLEVNPPPHPGPTGQELADNHSPGNDPAVRFYRRDRSR